MTENYSLLLEHAEGSVILESSCLLVAIDETGQEEFADPNYPLFGLGGCVVSVGDYPRLIRNPWVYMKGRFFGDSEMPLHAAELRNPTPEQLDALGHFFRKFQFSRVAAVVTDRTVLLEDTPPYQIAARCLLERIRTVASWYPMDGIALIIEESSRADGLAIQHFSGYDLILDRKGEKIKVPIQKFFMPKKANEPFLEVADFVMHAAGTQTRARLNGEAEPNRKDFQAVFRDIDPRLQSFFEVTRVTNT